MIIFLLPQMNNIYWELWSDHCNDNMVSYFVFNHVQQLPCYIYQTMHREIASQPCPLFSHMRILGESPCKPLILSSWRNIFFTSNFCKSNLNLLQGITKLIEFIFAKEANISTLKVAVKWWFLDIVSFLSVWVTSDVIYRIRGNK